MGAITDSANVVWRDYDEIDVPASGAHKPVKSEIRNLFGLVDSQSGGGAGDTNKMDKAANLSDVSSKPASIYNLGIDDIFLSPAGTGGSADFDQFAAAIATLKSRGQGKLRFSGLFNINQGLTIDFGLHMIGDGFGSLDGTASGPGPNPRSILNWTPTIRDDNAVMIRVSNLANDKWVYDAKLDGFALKGNNFLGRGIHISSTKSVRLGMLWVERCTVAQVQWDNANTAGDSANCGWDWLEGTMGTHVNCKAADGVRLLSVINNTGMTHFQGDYTRFAIQNGDGLVIGDIDQSQFGMVSGGASDGDIGRTVVFCGTAPGTKGAALGQTNFARKNSILNAHGKIFAETGSRNSILSPVNSEGSKVIVQPGATLNYRVIDRNTGQFWAGHQFPMKYEMRVRVKDGQQLTPTPPTAGPATLAYAGTHLVEGNPFDGSTTERLQWYLSRRSQQATGTTGVQYSRIIGIELTGLKFAAAGSGVVKLEFQIDEKTPGDNPGGNITRTETKLVTVSNATQLFEHISHTFADPINFGADAGVLVRVARLGADAEDTFDAQDYLLCGDVVLLCVNDPAPSDNANKLVASISVASGVVTVTVTAGIHNFINGELIRIKSVTQSGGTPPTDLATNVNNKIFKVGGVTVSNQNSFTLAGIDGSTWTGTYSSGGVIEPVNRYQISDDVIS